MKTRNTIRANQPATLTVTGGIIEVLEARHHALKVSEVADLLRVTRQHIYKMAANHRIPAFLLEGAVRIDPKQLRDWLMKKMPQAITQIPERKIAV